MRRNLWLLGAVRAATPAGSEAKSGKIVSPANERGSPRWKGSVCLGAMWVLILTIQVPRCGFLRIRARVG